MVTSVVRQLDDIAEWMDVIFEQDLGVKDRETRQVTVHGVTKNQT